MTDAPAPEFQLEFLDYIQRVLDDGSFVATYKFALMMALADLSVEKGDDNNQPLELPVASIAEKFIQYYARQTVPYPAGDKARVLSQNTGEQAKIICLVAEAQAPYSTQRKPVPVARLTGSNDLVREVARTVATMPLWKLQVIAKQDQPFLYPQARKGRTITLNPGIAYCFRRFHGFVTRLAQDGWLRHVRRMPTNSELIGEQADLASFLFGTARATLVEYRKVLAELQGPTCFYCHSKRQETDIDHFIPWSWYSLDLGHNFVLACRTCNNSKGDSLAAMRHLENWVRRNDDYGRELTTVFKERGLACDHGATRTVGIWAYGRLEAAHGVTWVRGRNTEGLSRSWHLLLRSGP